jgi:hypothetical protein
MSWVIDRIESDIAVIEQIGTDEVMEVPKANLPKGAREGIVLRDDGNGLQIDQEETKSRIARMREKFNRLRKK